MSPFQMGASDISAWDTSNVRDFTWTFSYSKFNQNLSAWDMGEVKEIRGMFFQNHDFNGDVSAWKFRHLEDPSRAFYDARAFNQPMNGWNMTGVKTLYYMLSVFLYKSILSDYVLQFVFHIKVLNVNPLISSFKLYIQIKVQCKFSLII